MSKGLDFACAPWCLPGVVYDTPMNAVAAPAALGKTAAAAADPAQ